MIGMTVCSGIGAPELSAPWIDWRYQSEIEPFPSAVLAARFPNAVNLGDMNNFEEWPDATVDVLCGGTPCQSFSVAGLRKGLDDPRGNLMLTYLAIARRYRPRWLVWENVPGVLSSNEGRDFGTFLRALGELGYGFAYRVLDAQYVRTRNFPWAVPQRRRRVFVVGYLGDWRRAAAVLFDGESMSGNPAPRREAGKASPTIPARSTGGGGLGTDFDLDGGLGPSQIASTGNVAHCLNAGGMGRIDYETETMIAHALRGEGFDASEYGTGRSTPIVPVAIQERAVSENPENGPQGAVSRTDGAAYTLEARNKVQAVAFDCKGSQVQTSESGVSPPLRSMGHHHSHQNAGGHAAVAFAENSRSEVRLCGGDGNVMSQLTTGGGKPGQGQPTIATPWAVRRLTPTECERLQGFPDCFTVIEYRGKPAADGPRYKALGNSWAINCGEWIFDRIRMVEALDG